MVVSGIFPPPPWLIVIDLYFTIDNIFYGMCDSIDSLTYAKEVRNLTVVLLRYYFFFFNLQQEVRNKNSIMKLIMGPYYDLLWVVITIHFFFRNNQRYNNTRISL